ncbi:MAG: four helix bundle protein [Opitutales bacterium]
MKIECIEDIKAWQKARVLTRNVYDATKHDEFSRDYGLEDQITRATCSIMHNIAEGFDSGSNAEFIRFLRYAQRSASEVQSQCYVALDQHYINQATFDELYALAKEAKSLIGGFTTYFNKN